MKNNPYIELIRNTNFRNIWLGQVTSQIALNMLSFVLAIRVYKETGSNTAVSIMLLTFGIPSILFGFIAGGLVDHFNKRNILVFCNVSRIFILILFYFFFQNLFSLYILSVIISIVTQLFIPAEASSIPNLVKEKLIMSANSLFTVSFYLSSVLGFIFAGPFIKLFGHNYIYLVMAGLLSLASFFVWQLPRMRSLKKNIDKFSINLLFSTMKEGFVFIKSNIRIEQSLILMTFSQSLITTLAVLAPGFSDKVLSIDLNDASFLVMGPAAIGLIFGAVWVGQYGIRYLKGKLILFGILAIGLSLIGIAVVTSRLFPVINKILQTVYIGNLGFTFILLILLGTFNSFVSVSANTILQEDSDTNMRGRVYGVLTSLTGGASLIPVIFSGILADVVGVSRTLLILGFFVLFVGVYHYLQRQKVNNTIN
jgi:MFS family permease